MKALIPLLLAALFAIEAVAQDALPPPRVGYSLEYRKVLRDYPEAKIAVLIDDTPAFEGPSEASPVNYRLRRGDFVAVVAYADRFLGVATVEKGIVGFVPIASLVQTERLARAEYDAAATPQPQAQKPFGENREARWPDARRAYKDPGLATLLSVIVTGGGHLYAGETTTGIALLAAAGAGIALGLSATLSSVEVECTEFRCEDKTDYMPMFVGYGMALGAWIYGVADGGKAAERANEGTGFAVAPQLQMQPGGPAAGLAIRYAW